MCRRSNRPGRAGVVIDSSDDMNIVSFLEDAFIQGAAGTDDGVNAQSRDAHQ
jgi:hypothetical protein